MSKYFDKINFAIRTVRNGYVIINRCKFYPEQHHMKYDGRLDGMKFLFGLYKDAGGKFDNKMISLCSDINEGDDENPFAQSYVINGTLPWVFWKSKNG